MKSILYSIYFIIRVHYPSDDINTVRYYNKVVDDVMKEYCWLNVEYDLTNDTHNCDVNVYFEQMYFEDGFGTLGTTTGKYIYNSKVFGVPYIRMSYTLTDNNIRRILCHEMGHFLGLGHSIDEKSLMYPIYSGDNKYLSRHDSLSLLELYSR